MGTDRWAAGSGYLIGGSMVLTAAHNVGYRQDHDDGGQLLIRTIAGAEFRARAVLVCADPPGTDLALLEIIDPAFGESVPPVLLGQVDRDSPVPLRDCWAVGFPRFGEAGRPVLSEGSRRETWHVTGEIAPGTKLRAGLLSLRVTSSPEPLPGALAGSPWAGMSGAVVFAADPLTGDQAAVGVISTHHRPEGPSELTAEPVAAIAGLAAAERWWQELGVAGLDALRTLPVPPAAAARRSQLAGAGALRQHWDPRSRGVEQAGRPGWFFTGRRRAMLELVAWLTAAPDVDDNVRVVTGGPGSGKSAVLARLVTLSDPGYRSGMPPPADADPAGGLRSGAIDIAVHARTATAAEVTAAIAAAARAPRADLDSLIDILLARNRRFTLAVDALDEAEDPRAMARLLRTLASQTADAGVQLLVGTRPGGPGRPLITALGLPSRYSSPTLIDLDRPPYLSRDDLVEYVRRRLVLTGIPPSPGRPDTPYRGRGELAGQVAAAVADAAYPAFLIGQLVSRALVLRPDPVSPNDPDWQHFPKTVAEAMDRYLGSAVDEAGLDRAEDLLRPLAYARGDGLPLDDAALWPQLATALARPGRSYSAADVAGLLNTAADYLIETVITGEAAYYRLYHQALADRLRERDEQHPGPYSTGQKIYRCLLASVPPEPDGTRAWAGAHPYLQHELAGYAAEASELASLIEDPRFLTAADPPGLFAALQRPGQPAGSNAQVYRLAFPSLSPGIRQAGERASYLQLAARRLHDGLADQLDQLPLGQEWRSAWVRGQRHYPHYIAGRWDWTMRAVAVGVRRGRPVIVAGAEDGSVLVWDLETGELVLGPLAGHDAMVGTVAIGVRGSRPVIVSAADDRTIRVWDLDSGELVLGPVTTGHDSGITAVAIAVSQGQQVIASAGHDGTVRVWDLDSGKLVLGPVTGHDGGVGALAAGNRHGRPILVSAGDDGKVQVWDLTTGELTLGPLEGHSARACALTVGVRQGRSVIVSGARDGTVRVWDLETGEPALSPLAGSHGMVYAVALGVRGGRPVIISGQSTAVRLWDLDTGKPVLGPLIGHDDSVFSVATGVRHGRPVIVSAGADRTVRVWDVEPVAQAPGAPAGHQDRVLAVATCTRRGRSVAVSAGDDMTVRVWDVDTGDLVLGPLTSHTDIVTALAADTRHGRPVIASGGYDNTIRVWDLDSGELVLGPLTGHDGAVRALAAGVRHGQPVLVSGSDDRTVRVWDLETGRPALNPLASDSPVFAVAAGFRTGVPVQLALFGQREQASQPVIVATGYDGGALRVWDLDTGEPTHRPGGDGYRSAVFAAAIGDRDGHSVLVSAGEDELVHVRSLKVGAPVLPPLAGHQGRVKAVALGSHHGRPVIASAGEDRTVRIWDLQVGGNAILRIDMQHSAEAVAFAADRLIVGTSAEILRIDLL
ncbi:MAG: hypothetical protein ABSB01_26220 [Streptosporangiaceae bacterium]